MQEGDLVHIPQGTEMWDESERGMKIRISEKPLAGVYLSARGQYICRIYENGRWNVKKRDVYPMEEKC